MEYYHEHIQTNLVQLTLVVDEDDDEDDDHQHQHVHQQILYVQDEFEQGELEYHVSDETYDKHVLSQQEVLQRQHDQQLD